MISVKLNCLSVDLFLCSQKYFLSIIGTYDDNPIRIPDNNITRKHDEASAAYGQADFSRAIFIGPLRSDSPAIDWHVHL